MPPKRNRTSGKKGTPPVAKRAKSKASEEVDLKEAYLLEHFPCAGKADLNTQPQLIDLQLKFIDGGPIYTCPNELLQSTVGLPPRQPGAVANEEQQGLVRRSSGEGSSRMSQAMEEVTAPPSLPTYQQQPLCSFLMAFTVPITVKGKAVHSCPVCRLEAGTPSSQAPQHRLFPRLSSG